MSQNFYVDHDSMKKIGINILTGEACALSMRLLCEITPEMMQLYLSYTGIHVDIANVEKSQYNDNGKYSVFLTWEQMEDLLIMKLMENYSYVIEILPNETECKNAGVRGNKFLWAGTQEEFKEEMEKHPHLYTKHVWNEEKGQYDITQGLYDVGRTYFIYGQQPRRGFSNIHGFTGLSQ